MSDEGPDLSSDSIQDPDLESREDILAIRAEEERSRIQQRKYGSYIATGTAVVLFVVSICLAFRENQNQYIIGIFVASATLVQLKALSMTLPDRETRNSNEHPLLSAVIRTLDALKDYMNRKKS